MTLEFIDGQDLGSLRVQQPESLFKWERLRPLMTQLCDALECGRIVAVVRIAGSVSQVRSKSSGLRAPASSDISVCVLPMSKGICMACDGALGVNGCRRLCRPSMTGRAPGRRPWAYTRSAASLISSTERSRIPSMLSSLSPSSAISAALAWAAGCASMSVSPGPL